MAFAVGMDLGGTNARAAVVDARGVVVSAHRQPLSDTKPASAAEALAACVREAMQRGGFDPAQSLGYGVGVAGQIEASTRRILVAPNLGWRDLDFASLLEDRLQAPVRLANDLSVAALGEARAGSGRGFHNAVLVFVGSGVGAGLVLDDRLYEGARGVAGELGHIKVQPGGRRCGCGELGCLEAYAGGHNLGQRAAEAIAQGRPTRLEVPEGLTPSARMLALAATQGDALSRELLEEAAQFVGVAAANVVTLLNPDVLVLGGGVLAGSPLVREVVEQAVRANASRASVARLAVVDAVLGDDAGIIGAAFLGRESVAG